MRYSFDQIEAFVAAARHNSFSKAAKVLGKAQSTVSLAISNLEIDLGVQLFDRSTKYPSLTDEGKALLAEAESVLFHCRVFEERSLNLLKDVEPYIKICTDETVPMDLFGNALSALAAKYPNVDIIAVAPSGEGVVRKVMSGEADLGITMVNYNYPEGIGFYRLGQMRLVNVVHHGHPLAKVGTVRFSHLNATRQLLYGPNGQKVPTNQHFNSSSIWVLQNYSEIIELLRRGLGWAVLPLHMAEEYFERREFVKLTLEAYPRTPWRINVDLVWASQRKPGAVALWMREFLGNSGVKSGYIV